MNLNRILLPIILFTMLLACQREHILNTDLASADKNGMDEYILQAIKESNAPFDWNDADDATLWQALLLTDKTLVIGYSDGVNTDASSLSAILQTVYESEDKIADQLGDIDDLLIYKDDVLGFMMVRIDRFETLQKVRELDIVTFTEVNDYIIEMEKISEFTGVSTPIPTQSSQRNNAAVSNTSMPEIILDPYLTDPPYTEQVFNYKPGLWEVLVRHNIDEVYTNYQNFGEGIGVAVIDNGIVEWALELFLTNGYGGRETLGFYNPFWFLAWTQPDGISPQPSDIFGISAAIENQWLHGSGMIESAFVIGPNSDITSVRGSTAIVVLTHSQILGISNGIKAMANRPDIRITNMSMGTIFMMNRIRNAINYYHSKGKIMACAAGTTFKEVKELLGIIFPAYLDNTVSVTGIENREETNGEFIAGETAHIGIQNDFCVENSAASSEATARMVGMLALIWSADPELTREEVLDIAITSSHFYHLTGQKDPSYGWGTVDVLEAVERAMEE